MSISAVQIPSVSINQDGKLIDLCILDQRVYFNYIIQILHFSKLNLLKLGIFVNANLDFELIKIQTRMVIQFVSMMMNVSWVHQRATNLRNAGIHLEATSAIANTQMKHVAQKVFEV